jgi:hypothetical protein
MAQEVARTTGNNSEKACEPVRFEIARVLVRLDHVA